MCLNYNVSLVLQTPMMYSVVLIVAVFVVVASAHNGHGGKECMKLFSPTTKSCCKTEIPGLKDESNEVLKECFKSMPPPRPPSCEVDVCIAKKLGYAASEDGKFDKIALKANIEQQFEQMPAFSETVIKNCVEGDLSTYGPPEFCDLAKLRHCIHSNIIMACPDWDDSGDCSGTKELVQKCNHNMS